MNLIRTWFARRPKHERFEKMANVVILQFFPGLGRKRFDTPLQAAGNSVLACLWHQLEPRGERGDLNTLPFRGYTAEVRGDGLYYGGARGCEFVLDLMIRPGVNNGRSIHPERQGGLLQRGLTMMRYANNLRGSFVADAIATFPEVLAAVTQQPQFEVTPALRRVAAMKLNTTEDKLDEAIGVDQYLPQLFESLVRAPHSERNPTASWLIPAIFTTKHNGIFMEDFSDMLGVDTFNPVAMLLNPCRQICKEMNITYEQLLDVSTEGNRFEEYVRRYRDFLGAELHVHLNSEDIERAALTPDEPLTTAEGKTLQDILGPARFLESVRKNMAEDYRDLASQAELEAAVLSPEKALHVAGVCRPQAVYLQKTDDFASANHWQPSALMSAVHADLWTDKLRVKPKRERRSRQAAGVPAA